jgi:hypothetical protein
MQSAPSRSLLQTVCPRLAGEIDDHYQLFLKFAVSDYSLAKLAVFLEETEGRKATPLATLRAISSAHLWLARRNKYRLELAQQEESNLDATKRTMQQKLAGASLKVIEKIEEMIEFPVSVIQVEESIIITQEMVGTEISTVTTINPGDWSMGTIGRLLSGVASTQRSLQDTTSMIRELKKIGYIITLDGKPVVTAQEASDIVNSIEDGGNLALAPQRKKRKKG